MTVSNFLPCLNGVRQGEHLHSFLFALYLNDLDTFLTSKSAGGGKTGGGGGGAGGLGGGGGGGAWVGEGSEDRLRSPAGPWHSTGRGPRGAKPTGSSGGLRNYRHLYGLWYKLLMCNIKGKMYNVILNPYNNIRSRIVYNDCFKFPPMLKIIQIWVQFCNRLCRKYGIVGIKNSK
jgi:hypothetical protein